MTRDEILYLCDLQVRILRKTAHQLKDIDQHKHYDLWIVLDDVIEKLARTLPPQKTFV